MLLLSSICFELIAWAERVLSEVFAEKELADRIELRFGVLTDAQKVKDVEERFALAGVEADSVMEDTERICGFYSKE